VGVKVVVGGILSLPPFSPGTAWDRLHYVLGLRMLGHAVVFVEEVAPETCVDSGGRPSPYERSVNRSTFVTTMSRFGLLENACQIYDGGRATSGLSMQALEDAIADADLLINISGHVKSEIVLELVRRRAYLDQDPVYTQLWDVEYGVDVGLDRHDVLLTVGANIGQAGNPVPDGSRAWRRSLPPVVLEYWPFASAPSAGRFTTVSSWGRYADLTCGSRAYRSKRDEFQRFRTLPALVSAEFELVLRADADDELAGRLAESGWIVRDAAEVAGLDDYRAFIARSGAEIAIAKGAYVAGKAGWLGDRSSHYLASGKPVLAQSTGLEDLLPTGEGLVTFSTLEEAVAGAEAIHARYEAHCRSARRLAEAYLSHDVVLPALLETAMEETPPTRPPVTPEV
jgi:hypothetical protein